MPFLQNAWYVAAWAGELAPGATLRRRLLGDFYVLYRDDNGAPRALLDRCPHRFAPLSMGKLVDDGAAIECPYHGLQFDGTGQCVRNPHSEGAKPLRAQVPALPAVEKYSAIWVWMGDPAQADDALLPDFSFLDPDEFAVAGDMIHLAAPYELGTDNIMDLTHIEYIHPLFSSSGVSGGDYECTREDDSVWSKRLILDDALPDFLQDAFGLGQGTRADRWLDARWDAPACMALWTGATESGKSREEGREVVGAHIFTPASEDSTHYFFATSVPRSVGPDADAIAAENLSAATGPDGVFTTEDKPVIEAAAENMQGQAFWALKPAILPGDAGGILARRQLAKRIENEKR